MEIFDEEFGLWAADLAEKIIAKMKLVVARNKGKIPYTALDGVFDDCSGSNGRGIGWWTNGFWGGLNWQLFNASHENLFKETAEWTEAQMDSVFLDYRSMDHDSGFRWLPTSYANYTLTKSSASYNRLRLAADNLAGRFNSVGNFIRAWNEEGANKRTGWTIIDSMMNLPLLYWAYKATGDYRYKAVATKHADTVLANFIRDDGSAVHIGEFNSETGEFIKSYGGQGYAEGSSWTRGQTWALYGLTLTYLHTGEDFYLEGAKKVASYFLSRIPDSGLIPVDFKQPAECTWEDSSAAAIAACGFIELYRAVNGEIEEYLLVAVALLKTLAEKRLCLDVNRDELLENCTAAYHDKEHNFPIIYGDYFFVEALWKLTGKEVFIWGEKK